MTESQLPMPDFEAFYRAINKGREPFPWQARLARQVREDNRWPIEVGVPTGLGKTACLDIAVWWLASQAHLDPTLRSAPTRIWWVVNRRMLVDSTWEHADKLAAALDDLSSVELRSDAAGGDITAVGDRLRSLSASSSACALEVIRLRGGVESRTPTDPSQPAVILSTLPMYGSRLLFRGYGSSRMRRPIDAAMAGTDSLVLLDEAHLAPHLRTLCDALQGCAPHGHDVLPQSRSEPQLVSLTATGGEPVASRFDLDENDFDNAIVKKRLDAPKPVELRKCEAKDVPSKLAEAMRDLLDRARAPAAGVVFANTPKTARQVFGLLRKLLGRDAEVKLLTGRAREREAEDIRSRILHPEHGMASDREHGACRDRHLVVVATQTLEVGADIDAEYVVTETCGVRALTQRFGRMNRLGRHDHARAVYLHAPPPKQHRVTPTNNPAEWPVYGPEPAIVWQRLQKRSGEESEELNLCSRHIKEVLGLPKDECGRAPEILYGLLWEWIKTTTPPPGEAPVESFFSGIARVDRMVSVIWRAHIPDGDGDPTGQRDLAGARLWPRAKDREAVSVPIWEFREALEQDEEIHRIAADRVTVERVGADDLRPGDSLVLPVDRGLLDEFGWEPSSRASPVVDVSLPGNGLPLDPVAIKRMSGVALPDKLIRTATGIPQEDGVDLDPAEQRQAVERIVDNLREANTPSGWRQEEWTDFVDSLNPVAVVPRGEVARLRVETTEKERSSDEFDERSLAANVESLDRHSEDVEKHAQTIANRLGMRRDLVEVVARAGRLHDIGKADERFQRWLDPRGDHTCAMLAKSGLPRHSWNAARVAAGWPRGGRHEVLSARLVSQWLDFDSEWGTGLLRELLLHLVISHHGHGRPLVGPVLDEAPAALACSIDGHSLTTSADLSEVDWEQPARFHRLNSEFGPWGLALLESIVCRADHAVSGRNSTLSTKRTT